MQQRNGIKHHTYLSSTSEFNHDKWKIQVPNTKVKRPQLPKLPQVPTAIVPRAATVAWHEPITALPTYCPLRQFTRNNHVPGLDTPQLLMFSSSSRTKVAITTNVIQTLIDEGGLQRSHFNFSLITIHQINDNLARHGRNSAPVLFTSASRENRRDHAISNDICHQLRSQMEAKWRQIRMKSSETE